MNPESDIKLASRLGAFLLAWACASSALDLSGTVLNIDGSPKAGVVVRLSGRWDSVITDASGAWSLRTSPSAVSRQAALSPVSGHLQARGGRLEVLFGGMDASGRRGASASADRNFPRDVAARTAGKVDSVVYSWEGRRFLRDTVSESRLGMVRIYDTTWNAGMVYGYLTDERDGQIYRTVQIGSQVWMAQNLNYKGVGADSGFLYDSSPDSVRKYGRLYPWTSALGLAESCKTNACSLQVVTPQRGICPTGWHVPSDEEWQHLEVTIGMSAATAAENGFRATTTEGAKLMSVQGWYSRTGIDVYGFRVLPAGGVASGPFVVFCTASEYDKYWAWNRSFYDGNPSIHRGPDPKSSELSLRCLRN